VPLFVVLALIASVFQQFNFGHESGQRNFFSCQFSAAHQYSNGSGHLREAYGHFLENASYHTKGDEKALI